VAETLDSRKKKRSPITGGILSMIAPGLGQIYRGDCYRGALILAAAIIIANLNIIILPLISMANPITPPATSDERALWAYWIPRIVHDVASFWSIVFYIWAIADAFSPVRNSNKNSN